MTGTGNSTGLNRKPPHRARCVRFGALACALVMTWAAMAQDAQPQPPTDPSVTQPAAPAPNYAFRPGFIDAFGRWLGNSKARLDEGIRGTQDTLGGIGSQANDAVSNAAGAVKDAAGAAKQATGVIVGLPGTRVVTGRQRCPLAPNGAPDCLPAAASLCKYRGFTGGRGLDINSAQKCPAWIWLQGRAPEEAECRTETFVTRAVCQ